MTHDLILKNARVIDPSQGIDGKRDVAILDGKISGLDSEIREPAKETIDLSGRVLTPGWIDIHTHVYAGSTTWGIRADPICLSTGVTTVVDAGSSGWANFMGLEEYVAERSRTQVLAFVHISGIGLTYGPLGEMEDIRYADPERTAYIAQTRSKSCVGIKVRQAKAQVGENGVQPLQMAVEAAEIARAPVMVHIGLGVPLPDVLAELRPGDIVTHCFHGKGDTILGENETVMPEVWQARERGVLFDLGHGGGSFQFEVAKKAQAQGFPSDVISTDLHVNCIRDPVHSLPETASKILNLGADLPEIVRQTTTSPATAICRGDDLGTLRVGTVADLTAFEVQDGAFEFRDVIDQVETGDKMIVTELTVREGKVYRPGELEEEVAEAIEKAAEIRALTGRRFEELGWEPRK